VASGWRGLTWLACSSIAQRRWTRTLDDRLGLSHEELRQGTQSPPTPLPVGALLADKP
jgi:hypothetical protein